MRSFLFCLCAAAVVSAQPKTEFEGRPSFVLANDKIELTVTATGGSFASLVLKQDPARMNPLWDPSRMQRELGQKPGTGPGTGHFVCVDGFGGTSDEERAAGLQGHGEAHRQPVEITRYEASGGGVAVSYFSRLPLVQEIFRRTLRINAGEQVVWVESELESLLAFDRPACWAEHATIGSPFLEPGRTVVDMPAVKARTRPYAAGRGSGSRRLASDREFVWPMGPLAAGGQVDLRAAPDPPDSMDHTTCLLDPSRPAVFVTALHPGRRLLLGYLFRQKEYPWLQCWDNYSRTGKLARGIEFSTQPFDVPRREAVSTSLFGAPSFRWLPAKSKIGSRYLIFYTSTPEGFGKVDDVRLENNRLIIEDRAAGKTIALAASGTL